MSKLSFSIIFASSAFADLALVCNWDSFILKLNGIIISLICIIYIIVEIIKERSWLKFVNKYKTDRLINYSIIFSLAYTFISYYYPVLLHQVILSYIFFAINQLILIYGILTIKEPSIEDITV